MFLLSLLIVTVFICGCPETPGITLSDESPELRPRISDPETIAKFENFFEGAPLPPVVYESDYKRYVKALEDERFDDVREKLTKYFGTNYTLWAYYFLDLDKDGNSDWTYVEDKKKFVSIDADMDNDGVANIMDADPYNPKITNSDQDGDKIPDHLDWDINGDEVAEKDSVTGGMIQGQNSIFNETGIIALNQDAKHDARTISTFLEVIKTVYGDVIDGNGGRFPGLKYLGAQQGLPESQTLAWFRKGHELIVIEDLGRKEGKNELMRNTTPLPFYSTIIHELGHALYAFIEKQNGKDVISETYLSCFWADKQFREKAQNEWIEEMNAEIDDVVEKAKAAKDLKIAEYIWDPRRQGVKMMSSNVAQDNNIISIYSLTSPQEYFAESTSAYVFKLLLNKRFESKKPQIREKQRKIMENYIEGVTGLRPDNLSSEGFAYIDSVLQLDKKLRWDSSIRQSNGNRGGWVRD